MMTPIKAETLAKLAEAEGGMLDGRATDCKSAGETQAGSTPAPLTTQLEKSVTLHLRRHLYEQVFGKFADAFFGIAEKRKQRREKMKERLKVWGLLAALLLLGLTLWHGHALLARTLGIMPAHAATPPNPTTEPAPRVIQVACGFHVMAIYVTVDAATLEPLYPLNNDPIEMAVMPAPCPPNLGEGQ